MQCAVQTVQKEGFLSWRTAISSNKTRETEGCPLERNLEENVTATLKNTVKESANLGGEGG